jgi:hypothetical protein
LVVPAFVDAASYNLGLVTGLAGLPLFSAQLGGGAENSLNSLWQNLKQDLGFEYNTIDTSGAYGLNQANTLNINAGFAAADTMLTTSSTENVTIASLDNVLSNVSISQASGISDVTVGSSTGSPEAYSVAGIASVLVDSNGATISAGSGPAVLIGGDNATLAGGAGPNIFLELGNDGTINGGAGAAQIQLSGSGDVATSMSSGTTATLNGTAATLNLGAGAHVIDLGTSDIVDAAANSSVAVDGALGAYTLGSDATVTDTRRQLNRHCGWQQRHGHEQRDRLHGRHPLRG